MGVLHWSIFLVLAICTLASGNADRNIDCRKFVFAPLCRGVAAKRGFFHGVAQDSNSVGEDAFRNYVSLPGTDTPIESKSDDSSIPFRPRPNYSQRNHNLDKSIYSLFLTNRLRSGDSAGPLQPSYDY